MDDNFNYEKFELIIGYSTSNKVIICSIPVKYVDKSLHKIYNEK